MQIALFLTQNTAMLFIMMKFQTNEIENELS